MLCSLAFRGKTQGLSSASSKHCWKEHHGANCYICGVSLALIYLSFYSGTLPFILIHCICEVVNKLSVCLCSLIPIYHFMYTLQSCSKMFVQEWVSERAKVHCRIRWTPLSFALAHSMLCIWDKRAPACREWQVVTEHLKLNSQQQTGQFRTLPFWIHQLLWAKVGAGKVAYFWNGLSEREREPVSKWVSECHAKLWHWLT